MSDTWIRLGGVLLIASLALTACGDEESDSDGSSNSTSNSTSNATSNATTGGTTGATTGGTTGGTTGATTGGTTGGTTVAPGVSMCGGFVPRNDLADAEACATCVDTACCDEATACGDDADCLALRECFAGCPDFDTECLNACSDSASEATLEINRPYIMCRNASCNDACLNRQDWSCVGQAEPPSSTAGTISLTVALQSFQSADRVPGATVKFCASSDPNCDEPLATETTDAEGSVTAEVMIGEAGFDGYMEVTGGERFPTLLYFSSTPTEDISVTFAVLGQVTADGFAAILGLSFDEERAHAAMIGFDCQDRTAYGLRFSAESGDDQTQDGYLLGGLPNPDATSTDRSGVGGVFNIPPGETTMSAELEDGTRVFEREVVLRQGFITSFSALVTAR